MAQNRPKPRNVFIPDEQYDWLRRRARELGTTISSVIREAIDRARTNA